MLLPLAARKANLDRQIGQLLSTAHPSSLPRLVRRLMKGKRIQWDLELDVVSDVDHDLDSCSFFFLAFRRW